MKKIFGDKEFIYKLIAIALPIGLQSAINMIVNLIDTVMVGTLGDIALSGVNLSSQFPYLYMTIFMGIGNAGMIIASQAWGNKKPDKVKAMLAFCLKICIFLNLIFFLLGFLFPSEILSIYTNEKTIVEMGTPYLRVLSFTFLIQSFSQIIVIIMRSAGVNKLGFYTSTMACLINMCFNWLLIFGHLGFPKLGVTGAAVATVIARIAEFIVIFVYLLRNKKLPFKITDFKLKIDKDMKSDYISINVPYTDATEGMLNASAFSKMKPGVRIINESRGEVVNDEDMLEALASGQVGKYVTDFPNKHLIGAENVICMPHLGACTPESEEKSSVMAAHELYDYLENGNIKNSVNFPDATLERMGVRRLCILHKNQPKMLGQFLDVACATGLNVENMINKAYGEYAYAMIDLNGELSPNQIADLRAVPEVIRVRVV